jgi:hypothetical protein
VQRTNLLEGGDLAGPVCVDGLGEEVRYSNRLAALENSGSGREWLKLADPRRSAVSWSHMDSLAPRAGVEPTTCRLGGGRSIH